MYIVVYIYVRRHTPYTSSSTLNNEYVSITQVYSIIRTGTKYQTRKYTIKHEVCIPGTKTYQFKLSVFFSKYLPSFVKKITTQSKKNKKKINKIQYTLATVNRKQQNRCSPVSRLNTCCMHAYEVNLPHQFFSLPTCSFFSSVCCLLKHRPLKNCQNNAGGICKKIFSPKTIFTSEQVPSNCGPAKRIKKNYTISTFFSIMYFDTFSSFFFNFSFFFSSFIFIQCPNV